jgi:hypothetical protein
MNQQELDKIKEVLNKFELEQACVTGVNMISGGFAIAEMFDYDDDYCDILLKWGVQSDCTHTVNQEEYKLNRQTFEIEDGGMETCIHNYK